MTNDLVRTSLWLLLCASIGCSNAEGTSTGGTDTGSSSEGTGTTHADTSGGDTTTDASTSGSSADSSSTGGGDEGTTSGTGSGSDGSSSESSGESTGSTFVECDFDELPLTFTQNVQPTFERAGCTSLSCHNNTTSGPSTAPETAYEFYLEGGWGDPATVIAGSSETSTLIAYLEAFAATEPTTLTAEDITRVASWIDEGALLGDLPVPPCAPDDTLSYADDVAPIFTEAGCSVGGQCHGFGGFFPLISHGGLVNQPSVVLDDWIYVVPGSVDESLLAWHMAEQHLPNDVLSKPEIAVVNRWIAGGAMP